MEGLKSFGIHCIMSNDGIQKFLHEKKFSPMLADLDSFGRKLADGQFNELWRKFDELPEETKGILMAPEMPKMIEGIQKEQGLSDEKIETVSAIVREYFVLKKDEMWLDKTVSIALDRKDVSFVKEYIQKNILHIQPTPKVLEEKIESSPVIVAKMVSLPLLDALSKYQRLSDQLITESRITVKGESAPVRGSIRYWLRYYRDVLGIRKHSSMERGQFLFQGENTRRLNAQDREKLSQIFRSVDENTSLVIDANRQEIVFPAFEEKKPSFNPFSTKKQSEETLKTSFRPLEKFPESTKPIQKALHWNGKTENASGNSPESLPKETIQKQSFQKSSSPVYPASPSNDFVPTVSLTQKSSENRKEKLIDEAIVLNQEVVSQKQSVEALSTPVYETVPSTPLRKDAQVSLSPSEIGFQEGNMSFSSSHILPHEKEDQFRKEKDQEFQKKESKALEIAKPISIIRPRGISFEAQMEGAFHQVKNDSDIPNFSAPSHSMDSQDQKN